MHIREIDIKDRAQTENLQSISTQRLEFDRVRPHDQSRSFDPALREFCMLILANNTDGFGYA